MSDRENIKLIVEFRQAGLTWGQIEEVLFPESNYRRTGKGHRDSWKLARKYPVLAEGAHAKRVHGGWTPTQTIERLRPNVVKPLSIETMLQEVETELAMAELEAAA